jgi:hypothetical protein
MALEMIQATIHKENGKKKNQNKIKSKKLTKVGPMYLVQQQPFGNGDGMYYVQQCK